MDSALRPRDIQARIRSGETAEAVAAAAGTSVEKIMPYAAPVLAERAHVAERAQKSSVRRRSGEGSGSLGGGRTLSEAVAWQLRAHNTDPETVEWDAFRREDGRWTLTGLFSSAGRTGVATFTFDVPGNYVTLDDDDARWLVGDGGSTAPVAPPAATETGRRLSAVPNREAARRDELDDAVQLATAGREDTGPDTEPTVDLTETVARTRGEQPPARTPEPREPAAREQAPEQASAPANEAPEAPEEKAEPQPKKSKKRGRASVPSWDEIMFGGGSGE